MIHLHDFVGRLLVFLEHARQSHAIIGYDGTLEIRMVLERMRGKPFIHFPEGFAMKGPESYLDDNISFDLSSPSLRLHTSRDAVAVDGLRILLFAVNFSEIAMEDTQTYRLLDHGYSSIFGRHALNDALDIIQHMGHQKRAASCQNSWCNIKTVI